MTNIANLIGDFIFKNLKDSFNNGIILRIEDIKNILSKEDQENLTIEQLKIEWRYEEINVEKYTFSNAVTWIKLNIGEGIKKAAILKNRDNVTNIVTLKIILIDENNNPVLDGKLPQMIINTYQIDEELMNNFGDKNLLIIK